ncbi:unnamed protein product [Heligmosomoides polygyrus]|uniref:Uncharacterized protein n=1 Tax=Heligmosomoides polygyrus TaxID=6339 RepID=A0A183FNY6_HELPZ|nr:unnamed protein product [Heligmosomoides polygyrus]
MAFRPVRSTTTYTKDQTTSSTSRANNTTTTQPTTTSAQPTASQESHESGDLLFAHFAQILQRDPEVEAPILRQLVEELNQFREVAVEPDMEVLSGAVDLRGVQRSLTVIERTNALVRRRDPKVTLDRKDDLELQYASVPPDERQLLALMQKLTIALNLGSVFSIAHLGTHDYVQIDAYLRSDFYRSIRSNFTWEIYLPQ